MYVTSVKYHNFPYSDVYSTVLLKVMSIDGWDASLPVLSQIALPTGTSWCRDNLDPHHRYRLRDLEYFLKACRLCECTAAGPGCHCQDTGLGLLLPQKFPP